MKRSDIHLADFADESFSQKRLDMRSMRPLSVAMVESFLLAMPPRGRGHIVQKGFFHYAAAPLKGRVFAIVDLVEGFPGFLRCVYNRYPVAIAAQDHFAAWRIPPAAIGTIAHDE